MVNSDMSLSAFYIILWTISWTYVFLVRHPPFFGYWCWTAFCTDGIIVPSAPWFYVNSGSNRVHLCMFCLRLCISTVQSSFSIQLEISFDHRDHGERFYISGTIICCTGLKLLIFSNICSSSTCPNAPLQRDHAHSHEICCCIWVTKYVKGWRMGGSLVVLQILQAFSPCMSSRSVRIIDSRSPKFEFSFMVFISDMDSRMEVCAVVLVEDHRH